MEAGGKPTGAQAGRGLGFSTLDPVFRCDDIGSYLDEDELIPGQADQDYPVSGLLRLVWIPCTFSC